MVEPSSITTTSPPLQRTTPEPPLTSHCLDELYEIHKRGKDPPSFLVLLSFANRDHLHHSRDWKTTRSPPFCCNGPPSPSCPFTQDTLA
ncbi:hypothetical protein C1H46_010778 [Malus baccata]|uniref:Uncharacterized protein n=1 Tax=Malus baccata TaxID=106549 RepID=A0A540MXY3_MALBA|nr:hypothetical protein C1H46_010778 [Malus baccata]